MLTISGTGCALVDYLYADVRFNSEGFLRYMSRHAGDGGLEPGRLVFVEDLERFAGEPFTAILHALSAGREPDRANLGGPSIVSLIHAAQMLEGRQARIKFFGARGNDAGAATIMDIVSRTPLDVSGYLVFEGDTPFTQVFSDPTYDHGHGERTFVNELGVADLFAPSHLPDSFFDADIVAFGGTALVPQIHDSLDMLCRRARRNSSLVVVNTVYDFRSESKKTVGSAGEDSVSAAAPGARWPLGARSDAYPYIDVLVADREEALKLSGTENIGAALAFFRSRGTSSAIVTDGARDIHFYSDGSLFAPVEEGVLPVSAEIRRSLESSSSPKGDTTGCGDNFAGGLLASLALQLEAGQKRGTLDIIDACSMAIVSGGFSCFYLGGTYMEEAPGEKRRKIEAFYTQYREQLSEGR